MENIIFMDGEFAELKPNGIDLLSIALIKPNGEELYLEIEFKGKVSPFVKKHVLPFMNGKKITKAQAVRQINKFVGKDKPNLVAYINQFDWMGVCCLFDANNPKEIAEKVPFHWVPIDLSSILFEKGIKPGTPIFDIAIESGIDISGFSNHNALDDARILKKVYEKMVH